MPKSGRGPSRTTARSAARLQADGPTAAEKAGARKAAEARSHAANPLAVKPMAELLGEKRVAGLRINLDSMALVSNIHRASATIRDHFERTVLTEADLHWSAFVTLWCLWIYGELETRRLAHEAGVAKSTLSGILNALEARKLVKRRTNEAERRLVIVNLTASGTALIGGLFPKFNAEETRIVSGLTPKQIRAATDAIRVILATIHEIDPLAD